jgi:hypothetical protein
MPSKELTAPTVLEGHLQMHSAGASPSAGSSTEKRVMVVGNPPYGGHGSSMFDLGMTPCSRYRMTAPTLERGPDAMKRSLLFMRHTKDAYSPRYDRRPMLDRSTRFADPHTQLGWRSGQWTGAQWGGKMSHHYLVTTVAGLISRAVEDAPASDEAAQTRRALVLLLDAAGRATIDPESLAGSLAAKRYPLDQREYVWDAHALFEGWQKLLKQTNIGLRETASVQESAADADNSSVPDDEIRVPDTQRRKQLLLELVADSLSESSLDWDTLSRVDQEAWGIDDDEEE